MELEITKEKQPKRKSLHDKKNLVAKKTKYSISLICRCTAPIKTITNTTIEVNVYVCEHVCKKFGFYSGDRVQDPTLGYGYVMGVGLVTSKNNNPTTALFIRFDSMKGCKFYIDPLKISEMKIVFRPDYDHHKLSRSFDESNSKALHKLKTQESTKDVSFSVDGKLFKAHKCLLASRSEPINALLTNQMKETTSEVVVINDVKWQTFESLLGFCYGEEIVMDQNNVLEVLDMADRWMLEDLKIICQNRLFELLDTRNIFDTIKIFTAHKTASENKECFEICARFILENYESLKTCEKFDTMMTIDHPFMTTLRKDILKRTTLIK